LKVLHDVSAQMIASANVCIAVVTSIETERGIISVCYSDVINCSNKSDND
jgi:hypothetical protein